MSELNVYHHELRPDEYDEFYLKYEADKVIAEKDEELHRHKYKRCLAMARMCEERSARYDVLQERHDLDWGREIEFYYRWYKRWLELAEKFKEAK